MQDDTDADGLGDACDCCPLDPDPVLCDIDVDPPICPSDDLDGEGVPTAQDNCPDLFNPAQVDVDGDGDACDLDDDMIYVTLEPQRTLWQQESGYNGWNLYRGDLDTLKSSGVYTQPPGSNPLAARECGLSGTEMPDTVTPDPGQVAFFLTTGIDGNGESELDYGRPNDSPCP